MGIMFVISILYFLILVGLVLFAIWAIKEALALKSEQNEILRELVNKLGQSKDQ